MKNENSGDNIMKFISLQPKVYSFETEKGVNMNKVKGCSSKNLSYERYRHVLLTNSSTFQTRNLITSQHMHISIMEVKKK